MVDRGGLEPPTIALRGRCSTNWAIDPENTWGNIANKGEKSNVFMKKLPFPHVKEKKSMDHCESSEKK